MDHFVWEEFDEVWEGHHLAGGDASVVMRWPGDWHVMVWHLVTDATHGIAKEYEIAEGDGFPTLAEAQWWAERQYDRWFIKMNVMLDEWEELTAQPEEEIIEPELDIIVNGLEEADMINAARVFLERREQGSTFSYLVNEDVTVTLECDFTGTRVSTVQGNGDSHLIFDDPDVLDDLLRLLS